MRLQYLGNKDGRATLVFLHGWCCLPEDFKFQVEHFKNDFQILLLNYSDFISQQSEINGNHFTCCVDAMAQEISSSIDTEIILIGHSMGGVMALALLEKLKERVTKCVVLDSSIPKDKNAISKYVALIKAMRGKLGARVLSVALNQKMINQKFDNINLMKEKVSSMLAVWQKSPEHFTQLLADADEYDSGLAIEKSHVPILYIASDPAFGNCESLKALRNDIEIQQVSSGHFVMLNQSSKVNDFISEFLSA